MALISKLSELNVIIKGKVEAVKENHSQYENICSGQRILTCKH